MQAGSLDGMEEPSARDAGAGIERGDTGRRILLSLLFGLIWGLLEPVLGGIVVFALVWTLITRQPPPQRLREFSNRLVSYSYRIWRYLTYNEARVPFPFSDFPAPLEQPGELGSDRGEELRDELG